MISEEVAGFAFLAVCLVATVAICSSLLSGCKIDKEAKYSSLCYEQTKNEKCWNLNSALQAK